ncbi:hypothetical protein [Paenibacillus sp. GCM10027626]|uniref:hypothetical protein n=1 Tax=Paenibacillus sp. GCM10027626 TaxID=3273411 RepID=UPI00362DB2BE
MKVRFALEDRLLIRHLYDHYGLQAASIHFIPKGDSAYSYWLQCSDGMRYYLRLFDRRNDRQRANVERLPYYLPLTWHLYHQGLFAKMTYPLKARSGQFQTELDDATIVLFHYNEVETLADAYPLSAELVAKIARTAAEIHQTASQIDHRLLAAESYDIAFAPRLEACIAELDSTADVSAPFKQAAQKYVLPERERITVLMQNKQLGKLVGLPGCFFVVPRTAAGLRGPERTVDTLSVNKSAKTGCSRTV